MRFRRLPIAQRGAHGPDEQAPPRAPVAPLWRFPGRRRCRVSTSPMASSSRCSAHPAAARRRRCAWWRDSSPPTAESIFFDDARMNDVPPHRRNTAMVFQSYALFPHMTRRRERRLRPADAEAAEGGAGESRRGSPRHGEPARTREAASRRALRRTAAACRSGTRRRHAAGHSPVRRASVQPRRQAAREGAHRNPRAAAASRHHRALCHPRPGRGVRHLRPDRRHEQRQDRAGRRSACDLPLAGQQLRRRFRRRGEYRRCHEPGAGHRSTRRSAACGRRRRHERRGSGEAQLASRGHEDRVAGGTGNIAGAQRPNLVFRGNFIDLVVAASRTSCCARRSRATSRSGKANGSTSRCRRTVSGWWASDAARAASRSFSSCFRARASSSCFSPRRSR